MSEPTFGFPAINPDQASQIWLEAGPISVSTKNVLASAAEYEDFSVAFHLAYLETTGKKYPLVSPVRCISVSTDHIDVFSGPSAGLSLFLYLCSKTLKSKAYLKNKRILATGKISVRDGVAAIDPPKAVQAKLQFLLNSCSTDPWDYFLAPEDEVSETTRRDIRKRGFSCEEYVPGRPLPEAQIILYEPDHLQDLMRAIFHMPKSRTGALKAATAMTFLLLALIAGGFSYHRKALPSHCIQDNSWPCFYKGHPVFEAGLIGILLPEYSPSLAAHIHDALDKENASFTNYEKMSHQIRLGAVELKIPAGSTLIPGSLEYRNLAKEVLHASNATIFVSGHAEDGGGLWIDQILIKKDGSVFEHSWNEPLHSDLNHKLAERIATEIKDLQ